MRVLWRNPWSRLLLVVFLCGLLALPPLFAASFDIMREQYSGQGWPNGQQYAWVMLVTNLLSPFLVLVTLGSGLGLLVTASIRLVGAQRPQG